jgi:hypothetical protein
MRQCELDTSGARPNGKPASSEHPKSMHPAEGWHAERPRVVGRASLYLMLLSR